MTVTSVSTPYLGTAMLPAVSQADAQLTQMETEATTGEYANLGEHLGDSAGYELSLRNADDLLQSLTTANALADGGLSTTSNALSSLTSVAQTTMSSLIGWMPTGAAGVDLGSAGDDAMQSLVGYANAAYDGQYVFGGINSATPPMSSFNSGSTAQTILLGAFETQFGFAPNSASAQNITGAQMTSFLDGAYAAEFSGSAWTSNWSSASSTNTSAEISPGQTASTSTNLNAGGFQPLTQAFTMLAFFGDSSLGADAKQAVVTSATTLIGQGLTQLTNVGQGVGQMQAQIKQANDDMSTQMTLMKTQIGGLDDVDSTQLATQLNTLTTQLETAYQVTAQLQKLSLAQYLPA
jgi:flagellar hook-associated protein 3 FlgL